MTLRIKTLLIVAAALASLIVVLYLTSSSILSSSFAQEEQQDTRQQVERVLNTLSDWQEELNRTTNDYAAWDDTYAFIQDANEAYITANLVDNTFVNLKVNVMFFVDATGRVVLSKTVDLQQQREIATPAGWQAHLTADSPLLRHADAESSVTGIVLIPEGPMMIASRPILTSQRKGPIRGALIMGRLLDADQAQALTRATRSLLTIHRLDTPAVSAETLSVIPQLSDKTPVLVRPFDADHITGYTLLQDIYGRPALLLRLDVPRTIYHQGQISMRHLLLSLLIIGAAFSMGSLLVLERLVLSKLTYLSARVKSIGESGSLSSRVRVTGQDEVSILAGTINAMLQTLEHSQHDLKESEVKHRLLLTSIRFPILALKDDMTVFYCNDAYAEFVGRSQSELEGKHLLAILPGFAQTQSYAAYRQTLETGQPQEIHGPLGDRFLHAWIYRTPWGILSIAEDVTERKQAGEQVRQLNESLEQRTRELAALNKAGRAMTSTLNPEAVLNLVIEEVRSLLNVEGVSVLLRDPASDDLIFASATGPSAVELTGTRLPITSGIAGWVMRERQSLVVNDAQNDARFYDQVDSVTGLTTRSVMAVPLTFKGAMWGVVEAVNKADGPFTDRDREILEALASSAAIAIENARLYSVEQRRAIELTRALEQQRELERLQREFIQNVSHELRTPLGIIRGYAELLEKGELGTLQPEQQEPINIIARRTRMLNKLVEDIMATLEVQRQALKQEPIDLAHLARQAVDDLQIAAGWAKLTLTLEAPPNLLVVSGDPVVLRRMLDNLIGNALKFTPAGGRVTVYLRQDGDSVEMQVSDTGIGIPHDQLERVFDRFYQVDGSARRHFGGVGLGLALVKEIVEAHHGQITVTSQIGVGTTFTVRLPKEEKLPTAPVTNPT